MKLQVTDTTNYKNNTNKYTITVKKASSSSGGGGGGGSSDPSCNYGNGGDRCDGSLSGQACFGATCGGCSLRIVGYPYYERCGGTAYSYECYCPPR